MTSLRVSKGTFIFNSFDKNQDGRIYVHNIEAVLQYMVCFLAPRSELVRGTMICDDTRFLGRGKCFGRKSENYCESNIPRME